jgi:serine/threonine protein kinase
MLSPGEIVADRFRIVALLGEGGFGTTYSAHDLETEQEVAIKQLSLEHVEDWKTVELFEREAKILKSLDHPQIPDYVDFIDVATDDSGYIVQTLAPGKPLSTWLEEGRRFSEDECLHVARQVLGILGYLESLRPPVVHRDIKPANLIMDESGVVHLVDFGAVRELAGNTMSGSTMVGTLGYMAPEQLQGQATVTSDIYALGMTLVHLATGEDPATLPKRRLKVDFQDRVDLAPAFEYVIDRMLETVPEDRIQSPAEALKLLGDVTAMIKPEEEPDDQLDALVQQRQNARAQMKAKRERALVERRAKVAKRRSGMSKHATIHTEPDGFLLAYDPPILRRMSPGSRGLLAFGLVTSIFFTAVVVYGLMSTWHVAVVANVTIWSALFAVGGVAATWNALATTIRERIFVKVNRSGNFMVYRREGKPLSYGQKSELSFSAQPAGADEVWGTGYVRSPGFNADFSRLSDGDVAEFRKFAKVTGLE